MTSGHGSGPPVAAAVELERERATLLRAEQNIIEGSERLRRQRELVLELRLRGADIQLEERLEQSLDATLTEWLHHRDAIEQRIAHLQQQIPRGAEDHAHDA
jgi:hypothetical protein